MVARSTSREHLTRGEHRNRSANGRRPPFSSDEPLARPGEGRVDVEAEAAFGLRGEHVADNGFVQQAAVHEMEEYATLYGVDEPLDFARAEAHGGMEAECTIIGLGEEAVDDRGSAN